MNPERIATGVPGLDELIEGGLIRGDIHILAGAPGVGKTRLQVQSESSLRDLRGVLRVPEAEPLKTGNQIRTARSQRWAEAARPRRAQGEGTRIEHPASAKRGQRNRRHDPRNRFAYRSPPRE
ncbi:MAG: hypothetical protein E6K96_03795 [Thaumarchaeota archaeon]|nr:MAG: hypothetical protein E6K96_03795 [Nitrososphaerota archaeon]